MTICWWYVVALGCVIVDQRPWVCGGSAVDGAAPPTSTGRCFAIETYCIPEPIRLHYCRGALVMPKSDDGSGVGVLSPHAA